MRIHILTISIIIIFSLIGCEKPADISSPMSYEKQNIRFSYPSNWKVTEDVEQEDIRYLFVESPGDAIFLVQIYSKQDAVSLREFSEWFSAQAKQETSIVNIGNSSFSATEKIIEIGRKKGIKEAFSMTLLGEHIPHIREYYLIDTNNKVAFLISQTAREDLSKVEAGFNLILSSFVVE